MIGLGLFTAALSMLVIVRAVSLISDSLGRFYAEVWLVSWRSYSTSLGSKCRCIWGEVEYTLMNLQSRRGRKWAPLDSSTQLNRANYSCITVESCISVLLPFNGLVHLRMHPCNMPIRSWCLFFASGECNRRWDFFIITQTWTAFHLFYPLF